MSRLTLDRMKSLIDAAYDVLSAHEAMARAVLGLDLPPEVRSQVEDIVMSMSYRAPQRALTLLEVEKMYYDQNIERLKRNSAAVKKCRARQDAGVERITRADRDTIVPTVPAGTDLDAWHRGELQRLRAVDAIDRPDVQDTLDF